jgi:hypothetical protein
MQVAHHTVVVAAHGCFKHASNDCSGHQDAHSTAIVTLLDLLDMKRSCTSMHHIVDPSPISFLHCATAQAIAVAIFQDSWTIAAQPATWQFNCQLNLPTGN